MSQNDPMQYPTKRDYVNSLLDNKCDPILGAVIKEQLELRGLNTPSTDHYEPQAAFHELKDGIHMAMEELGLDMTNDSLKDTPTRFAKMFIGELTIGLDWDRFPRCATTEIPLTSSMTHGVSAYDQMIIERNLEVISLCEHHLQTIKGVCHVAYIPNKKLLGLSKFARIVEFFSRRPQVQERLTEQITASLQLILGTEDVAVVVSATHGCMQVRGALQHRSDTQTNCCRGAFLNKPAARQEFFAAIGGHHARS